MPSYELMTTAELSESLGVSPRQIARLVSDGKINPSRQLPGLRGAFLFDASADDVAAVLEAKRQGEQ